MERHKICLSQSQKETELARLQGALKHLQDVLEAQSKLAETYQVSLTQREFWQLSIELWHTAQQLRSLGRKMGLRSV